MIYSDNDILQGMDDGTIIISPFVEHFLNPNSYDVRLGEYFYVVSWDKIQPKFHGPIHIQWGSPVHLPSGWTVLGHTVERIGTFHNVVAMIHSKSTTRRMGVSSCDDAGFGDVGYDNHWTVELTSQVWAGVPKLFVGNRFAQMSFHETKTPPKNPYKGQYSQNGWPGNMLPKDYRDAAIRPTKDLEKAIREGELTDELNKIFQYRPDPIFEEEVEPIIDDSDDWYELMLEDGSDEDD